MNKIFPSMFSKPEKGYIFALIPCWLFVFVLLPMYMPLLGMGLWEEWETSVWLEIGYHVLNGIIMLALMSSYLKDEWFMVSADAGYYLKHVALTVGLILGTVLLWTAMLFLCGFPFEYIQEWLPVTEMSVSHTSLFLVQLQPVFGAITLSVFTPISICALFYCVGFAPICYHKPWLTGYLVHLPIHLLACWSYQKTDNVWTPIFSLAATNLLLSIVLPLLLHQ